VFVTKKSIPRRTFLQGMGCAVALPLLESMVPALTAAPGSIKRYGVVFVPHGERPGYWTPKTLGTDFQFAPIMKPLEPFRNWMTVVSNVDNPESGHPESVAGWATASHLGWKAEGGLTKLAVSLDQLIAAKIGQDTALPSLEVGTDDWSSSVGTCDAQCIYQNLAWKTPTTPLPAEINPRAVFERLFGTPGTTSQRIARLRGEKTVVDSLGSTVADLKRQVGTRDRAVLDDYLQRVQELERRIQKSEQQTHLNIQVPDPPIGRPDTFEEQVAVMFSLLTVAWQADITRVFTFLLDKDLSMRTYAQIGIREPHHSLSHHKNDPPKLQNLVDINTYHVSQYAKFVEKLKATPDGDGSLLDNSLVLYGCGMSESDSHSNKDIPTLLVGGGSGMMKGNRHLQAKPGTPLANVYVDILQRYGVETDKIGISNGKFQVTA